MTLEELILLASSNLDHNKDVELTNKYFYEEFREHNKIVKIKQEKVMKDTTRKIKL